VQALRVLFAVVGGLVVVATMLSVVRTMVVPRPGNGLVPMAVDRVVDSTFHLLAHRFRDYEDRDRVLAGQAPAYLVVLLFSWLSSLLVGYGLLLWPWTRELAAAMRESVSSLLTLGFAATPTGGPTAIDGLAAASGIAVAAVLIGYLPALYAAFNRRETEVTLLTARAGLPPWGPELLARTRYGVHTRTDDLPAFYAGWERWAADVAESHANYPVLVRFRSPRSHASWLVGLVAVLDSAALLLALSPSRERYEIRACLRMGFSALQEIGLAVRVPVDRDPDPDRPLQLSYEEFLDGVQRLVDVGFPIERSPQEAWPHFRGWRVNYEDVAYRLARATDAVPALWSGPRRHAGDQLAPVRPPNRLARDAAG
jgi:hypothetical protein